MNNYKRLLLYAKPYIGRLGLAYFFAIFAAGGNLFVPWILKDVIDKVLMNKDVFLLNIIALTIIIVFIIRGICFYAQTYLMSYVGQKVIIDIREAIYKKLQQLSLGFFEKRQTGTIMSYVTNDVGALQGSIIEAATDSVTEMAILIGSLILMFTLHWKLSLLTLITMPIVAKTMKLFGEKLKKTSFITQEKVADITAILQEGISSIRVTKSFVRENHEMERFSKENHANFRAQVKNSQVMATLTPVVELIAAVGVTLLIWYGGLEVINDNLTAGALIAFLVYATNLANPIKRLSRLYGNVQKAMAAAERVFSVLDEEIEIKEKDNATDLKAVIGKVDFKAVTFKYNENEVVLKDINLEVKAGQMVAIVGPSGAGKTTIVNLLPRFYDPVAGNIYIDDVNIADVTLASLREKIGIVPQETVLFNGSIYDNILYGDLTATTEEVIAAAKAANAHDFIMQMADQYQTQIGERGSKLSGGQRQRIAIARAILKNPRILILDEATSALDTESEKLVQDALDKLMAGRTSFVIAHRLSTILQADMIIVMEKGQIVERGNHEELLKLNGLYSGLYKLQFK